VRSEEWSWILSMYYNVVLAFFTTICSQEQTSLSELDTRL
jgi:hypothetical protein